MERVDALTLASGAEARLLRDGVAWAFEYELAGNLYADRYDPRDDAGTLVVAPTKWTRPDGAPTTPEVHAEVLEAFWTLAAKTGTIARILEWRPDLQCNVARRWKLPAGAFLVRVAAYVAPPVVEYLELDRTAFIPFVREGESTARIDPDRARWIVPSAAMDPGDAARIAGRIRNASPSDMVLSEAGWKIV
ncbi:MAG: hypothetical protein U0414_13375 [Polyangiaceae bacterium]